MVEFADKSEVRADKERCRWREALDQDAQLRIPHAKFRLLLKAEKEKKKQEKKRQEDTEKAKADGDAPRQKPSDYYKGNYGIRRTRPHRQRRPTPRMDQTRVDNKGTASQICSSTLGTSHSPLGQGQFVLGKG